MSAANALHVIPAIAPRYGGPSVAVIGMCRALQAAGLPVVIATTDADGAGRLPVTLGQVETYSGVPSIFFRRRVSESFKWSRPLGQWLQIHVRDFDVVHVHAVFSHSSIAAGRACQDAGVPYIVRPLGTLDPWSVHRKWLRKRVLFHLGVDGLLRRAAAMHYTSVDEMRLAETVVPGLPRGQVIPLGIDDALFAPAEDEPVRDASPYVLALSRLDEKKGLDVLIHAFHTLASEPSFGPWRLVIAGDGESSHVTALKALAGSGAGAGRIEFRGWVGGNEKTTLFRNASVFAAPSHQENFGISLVEALASGVPAIVTPGVNLARELQDAGAGWACERDLPTFTATLRAVLNDRPGRIRHGRAARAFAEQFRWQGVAAQLRELYGHVAVAGKAAPATAVTGEQWQG